MKTAKREFTMDLGANAETVAFGLESMIGYSVQAELTDDGALEGTIKLQSSDDAFSGNVGFPESIMFNANATWTDIPGSETNITEAGTTVWNVSDVYYGAVRVVWESTAGDGSALIKIESKGIQ